MLTALFFLWVTVMNPDGIANANETFVFGERCVIRHLQHIEALDLPLLDDQRLYRLREAHDAAGTACPAGTLFLMDPATLDAAISEEITRRTQKLQLREAIRERLKQGK
jgi:hypothetical protein